MPQIDLKKKLASSRKDLLDIGLRNTMINFRSGAKTLAVVDERSEQVLQILCRQNRPMSFAHMPEKRLKAALAAQGREGDDNGEDLATLELVDELDGIDWSSGLDGGTPDAEAARRHADSRLQTALSEERLFLSLLKIHSDAQTYVQEQGVNILFLALGFLHWYEADSAEKLRKAPLLLVPVELVRAGTRDAFHLRYGGDDILQNLSLAAKLKTDFALDLPRYVKDADADGGDLPPTAAFFAAVAECVAKQKRWKVVPDEIHLGFFSFGKFLMFNDLDDAVWPEDRPPGEHPLLRRLLGEGFSDERPAVAEGVHLDAIIDPGEVRFVRDADSSQTMAILEARAGRNLVIQGPPGTGKSQTITNIVAELIGSGKTVLFVAEKMAALEVVKRRLDECHLGDAVLELHSHKATKQSVLKELGRTLAQGKPVAADGRHDLQALGAVRDELNAYCEAVNARIGGSTVSFIDALGHHLRIERAHPGLPVWSFEPMKTWTQQEQSRARETVSELARHIAESGRPSLNPFWGSARTDFSPAEQARVGDGLAQTAATLEALAGATDGVARRLGLGTPATLADVALVCRAADRVAEAPSLDGVRLATDDWQARRDAIRSLLAAGSGMAAARAAHGSMLIEQAWEQDLLGERQHLAHLGDRWWRIFSGKYRQARARLRGLCRQAVPKGNGAALALVDAILAYQQQKRTFEQHASLGAALFGSRWRGQDSDWDALGRLSEWLIALHDELATGALPRGILDCLAGNPDAGGLKEAAGLVRESEHALRLRIEAVVQALGFAATRPAGALLSSPMADLRGQLQRWLESLPSLYAAVRFNHLREELSALALTGLVEQAADWQRDGDDLVHAFDQSWFSGLVEQGYAATPALARFDHAKQAHLIERFRRLDRLSLVHAQAELAKGIWDGQPALNQPGEMAIIRNELNKKRRLMPIRQLIDQAGRALQAIKPVFMMSPMSIASFLPPGRIEFDVVIFDEASQVKAVDAFGALLRGRQAIVVGDTRQMPPTDFFGRDIELEEEDNVTADIESVLSMFRARGAQERYLRWHYRSRHESLIAVSNVEFYDRKLVIFPSAGTHRLATGLRFVHLPAALYDRGRTRTNREEAKAVARAVMEHAARTPELSLGVVAFSVAQRDLIQVEVELLRRRSPELETFFTQAHPTEPFFIKNLENVQGDERDYMFISIGYGRNESGRIAREFGPVNRDGGERRLNVLISRAKMGMSVFCNFRADELELDASASHGVRALKHFLKYAETGELDLPQETGRRADSPFEAEVIHALAARGHQIEPQVGTAGYFIDIAVRDPELPGRYVLAIECDGAAYHSSRSARDRDRLRQGVLESLGWRFHRIWSTDWFRDPSRELERAVAAIEAARAELKAEKQAERSSEPVGTAVIERAPTGEHASAAPESAYRKAQLPPWPGPQPIHEAPTAELARLVGEVVSVEAPVHESDVTRRLMEAFGISRAGSRVTQSVGRAIEHGHRAGLFRYAQGFIYGAPGAEIRARNRSALEASDRKIELVAPEELEAALLDVIRSGFSIERDAAIAGALDALGFGRATATIVNALGERLGELLDKEAIRLHGERLTLA